MRTAMPAGLRPKLLFPVAFAAALGFAVPSAEGLPPKRSKATCTCMCDAPGGMKSLTYDAIASCGAFEGKTCNFETTPGVIRSGRLTLCEQGSRWVDGGAEAQGTSAGVLSEPPPGVKPRPPVAPSTKPAEARR